MGAQAACPQRLSSGNQALHSLISDLANRAALGYGGVMRTLLIPVHPSDTDPPDGERRRSGHDVWEHLSGCRSSLPEHQ